MLKNQLLRINLLVDRGIVEETLSRMGIGNIAEKKLYQSCFLVKMWGDYYLAHFKQLFQFIKKNGTNGFGNVSQEDMNRRDSIAFCLKQWHLIDYPDDQIDNHDTRIFVVPHQQKHLWHCIQKVDMRNIETLEEHY